MSLSASLPTVFEHEHQASNLVDQFWFVARQAVENIAFGRAIAHVEHLGNGWYATGLLERLAHEHAHALRQSHFDFFDGFGAGLAHLSDALNDRQLPGRRQTIENTGRYLRRHMAEHHSNGLRMLVDQERQHVLRIGLVQKAEGESFQGLLEQRQHIAGIFAQRFLDQALGAIQTARVGRQGAGATLQELRNDPFLIATRDRIELCNSDGNGFNVTARQLGQ